MKRTLQLADSSVAEIRSPVRSCYLAKLYKVCYTRGRAALLYDDEINSLYLSLEAAMPLINLRRRQGTRWEVLDVPAVVVAPEDGPKLLLLGDNWLCDTLQNFKPTLPPRRLFSHFARAVMAQLPSRGWALRCDKDVTVASFPFGVNRLVRSVWKRTLEGTIDPTGAVQLVSQISLWLADV
jgi:hypothetical protein